MFPSCIPSIFSKRKIKDNCLLESGGAFSPLAFNILPNGTGCSEIKVQLLLGCGKRFACC